ncbi:D-alanyl-D-alanine carboxypeptidase family protein [Mediterraneibacter sp.]|uniref:D-alanyl-D-alanine carboxypeptidase family protein n=1 Tax=Mediterraneibacter sp. TaxID=2316022 RepID=UPI0027B88215|nr:D-alanyl-D-alanine carboxypeptidase [Mediterraneibacter sp.]
MNKNYYIDDKSRRKRSASQKRRRRRRRTSSKIAALLICFVLMIGVGIVGFVLWQEYSQNYIQQYEYAEYNKELISGELFAEDLCVAAQDVSLDGIETDPSLHGAGLFDLTNSDVKYGYKMFDQLYPASTTKIMTAYLALKYGNLDDVVTMSADSTNFNWDESTCGLAEGDSLTLYDLVCGLMLQSGNDCAAAIAEHISGSQEAFAEKMNAEAKQLGATGTHFVNPHGLHDEEHYTTAYDLYLMFEAALEDQTFLDIISMKSYTASVTSADGTVYTADWSATNYYSNGTTTPPDGIHVYGGKTGTTDQAGNCVILYEKNAAGNPYISVIMGASDKPLLYEEMNELLMKGMK